MISGAITTIAASLNNGDKVFLPRGVYNITGTLTLNPNTKLFGIPGQLSGLNGSLTTCAIRSGDADTWSTRPSG